MKKHPRHRKAQPRTPFSASPVPASDGSPLAAKGLAMSYKVLDHADLGPPLRALDWADSAYGMGKPFGPHTSVARTASPGGSSKATATLVADSLDMPQGTNLDPRERLPPRPEETPPSSIEDPLKPPQSSISSVGSDARKESNGFKMHGQPVFRNLTRMNWSQQ